MNIFAADAAVEAEADVASRVWEWLTCSREALPCLCFAVWWFCSFEIAFMSASELTSAEFYLFPEIRLPISLHYHFFLFKDVFCLKCKIGERAIFYALVHSPNSPNSQG